MWFQNYIYPDTMVCKITKQLGSLKMKTKLMSMMKLLLHFIMSSLSGFAQIFAWFAWDCKIRLFCCICKSIISHKSTFNIAFDFLNWCDFIFLFYSHTVVCKITNHWLALKLTEYNLWEWWNFIISFHNVFTDCLKWLHTKIYAWNCMGLQN